MSPACRGRQSPRVAGDKGRGFRGFTFSVTPFHFKIQTNHLTRGSRETRGVALEVLPPLNTPFHFKTQTNHLKEMTTQKTTFKNYLEKYWPPEKSFKEVKSGGHNGRPELEKALAYCKERGATLIVAKLDRLSHDLGFIAKLQDDIVLRDKPFFLTGFPPARDCKANDLALQSQQLGFLVSKGDLSNKQTSNSSNQSFFTCYYLYFRVLLKLSFLCAGCALDRGNRDHRGGGIPRINKPVCD